MNEKKAKKNLEEKAENAKRKTRQKVIIFYVGCRIVCKIVGSAKTHDISHYLRRERKKMMKKIKLRKTKKNFIILNNGKKVLLLYNTQE